LSLALIASLTAFVAGCRGVNAKLDTKFDETVKAAKKRVLTAGK
jgi:4-hydroxybenzoate polyprenyltransferase